LIRDVVAARNLLKLPTHPYGWYRSRISPDNRTVVLCSTSGWLLFWDAPGKTAPFVVQGHKLRIGAMCFSSDGSLLATASLDGTVKLWDPRTHAELGSFQSGADAFWSVSISPDNARVAAGSGQGTIAVWDRTSHELMAALKGHTTGFIGTVAFTPEGDTLVSAAKDAVRFWRAAPLSDVR
jgi:WD40 repeat protein